MELADGSRDVVDPEVRTYVSSLVTALGGSGADEDGRYVLGDDALAVLRDIKRWLKLYDEKANRLDVARCLAESNLVSGDLLPILASWPEHETDNRIKSKIALSCLELLVPLTWPIERAGPEMTVNHHRHTPYLQLAQLGYKRSIINYDGARILHTAVRVALPSMAEAQSERSSRDVGIIKLVLYFLRNIAMTAPPPNVEYEGDEAEISRSATIDAFDYQDIFHLLLTLSSTMGEDFSLQDVIVMEIIFHFIKGVNIDKLFMNEIQVDNQKRDELVGLRNQEAGMKRGYARTAPTRHNRFGTMIWVQREDGKTSTVSGQDALIDGARTLAKMDKSKKYKPPRRAVKSEKGPLDFDTPVPLSARANKNLRTFVEDFLDSGFNPLFQHIRKAIDREADRVMEYHLRQFFYLVSWFLEAERVRRKSKKPAKQSKSAAIPEEADSFALVASVLNQEMFITLNRAMENMHENKSWQDLNAAMKCFTQILLTVQEMSESPLDEDQEIAENILSRIFYEETTHDRVANITRYYKDQGFGYLNSCTELAHNYLRILENYSKQNAELVVRSKRRVRRKKKVEEAVQEGNADVEDVEESDAEDEAQAQRVSSERKFDFKRFAVRFLSQGCINTFVTFCTFYNDLNQEQLKRAHRFFYRVAFKMHMSVMLFRVDIVALFYKMIKGPEGLDSPSPMFKEWDEMVRQLIKKCTRKIEERPELIIEMLFSKTTGTAHYLEYGYEKQTITTNPRAAAELEVKPGMTWEEQVAVVVSVLLDRNHGDHLEWVKSQLTSAEVERRSWEQANTGFQSMEDGNTEEGVEKASVDTPKAPSIIVTPNNDACRIAMFKNGYLRLLMTLIGFQSLSTSDDEDSNTAWIVPSSLSADWIAESHNVIKSTEFNPPIYEAGVLAEDHIRRKSSFRPSKSRAVFDDEDENGVDDDEDEELFPAGGPTNMKKSDALAALKSNRRRRRKSGSDEDENDEEAEQRRKEREEARLAREREKQAKIKSALYVHDSDEESDVERDQAFFEKEEKLRQRQNVALKEQKISALKQLLVAAKKDGGARKRSATMLSDDSDDDDDDDALGIGLRGAANEDSSSSEIARDDALAGSDSVEDDTPVSSPHTRSFQTKRRKVSSGSDIGEDEAPSTASPLDKEVTMRDASTSAVEDEDEDEDVAPVARTSRRRIVSGFIMDSSDDE